MTYNVFSGTLNPTHSLTGKNISEMTFLNVEWDALSQSVMRVAMSDIDAST